MHHTTHRTEQLFIVRVWWEPDGVTATAQWRGSVQNRMAERRYFADWQQMVGYLERQTGQGVVAEEEVLE